MGLLCRAHPQAEKATQASDREKGDWGWGTAWAPVLRQSGSNLPQSLCSCDNRGLSAGHKRAPPRAPISRYHLRVRGISSTREHTRTVKSQPCPKLTDSDSEVGPRALGLTNPPGDSAEAGWTAPDLDQGFSALVHRRSTCLSSDPGASAQDSELIDFRWGSDFRTLSGLDGREAVRGHFISPGLLGLPSQCASS